MSASREVVDAFVQQLADGLAESVAFNQTDPPRLEKGAHAVAVKSDGFAPPIYEPIEGTRILRKRVQVELFVAVGAGADPELVLDDLQGQVHAALERDRTLGGRLYGLKNEQEAMPYFDGLEEGETIETFFAPDKATGGARQIEYLLHHAINPRTGGIMVQE